VCLLETCIKQVNDESVAKRVKENTEILMKPEKEKEKGL